MYAEIQEAVRFCAEFLYNKLPRRKVYLFSEQLANFIVLRYQDHWDPLQPHKESAYRCIQINVNGHTEPLLSVASNTVGLEFEEVLQYLPTELTIWVNPGEVSYRVGEAGVASVLYSSAESEKGALEKLMVGGSESGLKLSAHPPSETNWVVSSGSGRTSPVFELSSPHDLKFTVGSFAMTRFGTTKQKTNLAVLKQIQRKAVVTAAEKNNGAAFEKVKAVGGQLSHACIPQATIQPRWAAGAGGLSSNDHLSRSALAWWPGFAY